MRIESCGLGTAMTDKEGKLELRNMINEYITSKDILKLLVLAFLGGENIIM